MDNIQKALEAAKYSRREQVLHYLRAELGEPTKYTEVNGHLLDDDGNCQVRGCDLIRQFATFSQHVDRGQEWVVNVAEQVDCPVPLETFERYIDAITTCPYCDAEMNFDRTCSACGRFI